MKTLVSVILAIVVVVTCVLIAYAIHKAMTTPEVYALKVDGVEVMWFSSLDKCREADRDFRVMLSRSNKPSPGLFQCEVAF